MTPAQKERFEKLWAGLVAQDGLKTMKRHGKLGYYKLGAVHMFEAIESERNECPICDASFMKCQCWDDE